MRDYEIVLGKMLGSLLPIAVLFAVTVPFFAMLLLLGGVSGGAGRCRPSWCMAATAVAAGSLGGLVALWRERTFQALALSVLALVLYLFLVQGIGLLGPAPDGLGLSRWRPPGSTRSRRCSTSWNRRRTDPAIAPAYGFAPVDAGAVRARSNGFGIWKLRKWNPSGEPIMQREAAGRTPTTTRRTRAKAHAAPGTVRQVWANPILWREIRTLAYGRRPLLVKLAYGVVLALICYFAFDVLHSPRRPARRSPPPTAWCPVDGAEPAARQRPGGDVDHVRARRRALDLLLVTDLCPREFIFGKLGGVLYNTKEFLIPPLLLAVYLRHRRGARVHAPRTTVALRPRTSGRCSASSGRSSSCWRSRWCSACTSRCGSRTAGWPIVHTLGTVFFLSVGTLVCIYLIVINGGSFGNQWLSFIAFIWPGHRRAVVGAERATGRRRR